MKAFHGRDFGGALKLLDQTLMLGRDPTIRFDALLMRARCLRELGRPDEAETAIVPLLAAQPDNPEPAEVHAWIAHGRADWPEAERRWATMRKRWPKHFAGYFGGGAALLALGRFDDADRVYRHAIRHVSAAPHMLASFARAAQARRDWAEAARRWDVLRTLFPEEKEGHVGAAEALMTGGQFEAADGAATAGLARFPDEPKLLIAAARCAHRCGDDARSLGIWQTLRARNPGDMTIVIEEARALEEMGRLDEAEQLMAEATERSPEHRDLFRRAAELAVKRKDWDNAIHRFQRVIILAPDDQPARAGLLSALVEAGRPETADALIAARLKANPRATDLLIDHAELAVRQGDWTAAVERWRNALTASNGDRRAVIGLAQALVKQGDHDAADALTSDFASRFPDVAAFAMMHASVATSRRDMPEALRRWEVANAKFPGDPWGRDQLIGVLHDLGRWDESRARVAEAVARGDADLGFQVTRARSEQLAGNWPETCRILQALLKIDPSHANARRMLAHAVSQMQFAEMTASAKDDDAAAAPAQAKIATPAPAVETAIFDIVKNCESLGDNCEFGLFQRHYEAEPLGLLRWAATTPDDLTKALQLRLSGVGEPENTKIVTWPNGEYGVRDLRYGMQMHSFVYKGTVDHDRFTAQQFKRSRFLRNKLIEDIEAAEKLFVYKCADVTPDQTLRLGAALRAIGPATLLVVKPQDDAHPAGTVEWIADGLMVGYLDKVAPFRAPGSDISIACWTGICEKAFRLWKDAAPQPA